MDLNFYKYQGAGNDFILIDNRLSDLEKIDLPVGQAIENVIAQLCDRRFGVGADGLMFLNTHPDYDFEMVYHNANGKVGSMCGNGGRCIVAFAKQLGLIESETNFLAVDGPHYAKISAVGNWVELQMIDVDSITLDGKAYVLNTGSPHFVQPVTNLNEMDVFAAGSAIRNNDTYKAEGINVNFVELKTDHLFVRTFERGVEGETFACGTGATAVAMAIAKHNKQIGHVETDVKVLGGDLKIRFDYNGREFTKVFLCGAANLVFEGTLAV